MSQAQSTCTATDTAVTAANPGDAAELAGDCAALLGVLDTLRGTGTLNWANTLSMASWNGVTLASTRNRVTAIQLASKGLSGGSIPDLSALTDLTILGLAGNGLTGSVVVGNFPAGLQTLSLSGNALPGSIPDLSTLSNLQVLDLASSEFTGSIVAARFPATLQTLKLGGNGLTGSIPALSTLANLQVLELQSNELTGTIPALSALTSLQVLILEDNGLTGSIPALSALTNLQTLKLSASGLTGSIPDLSALTNLTVLQLGGNKLTGSIPALSALTKLSNLQLSQNGLTGSIPDLSALTSLTGLILAQNKLTGSIPTLSALTSLRELNVSSNELTGSIPDLSALTSLTSLWLHRNELTGDIPDLSALTSLRSLGISDNELTGSIPDLSALTSLTGVWLHRNGLTGSIPDPSALTSLGVLHLAWNGLSGDISQLNGLTNLQHLSLCENDLEPSATLPAALETRRTGGMLTVYSCLRLADAAGPEGTILGFGVTHSTWPVRGGGSLALGYETKDGTATSADYAAAMGSVTVPAVSATGTASVAEIEVATTADSVLEEDETFEVIVSPPQGAAIVALRLTVDGTIRDVPPLDPGPAGPDPDDPDPDDPDSDDPDPDDPDPDDPDPDDPDPDDDEPTTPRHVAPFWRGGGGFAVRPTDGRSAVLRLRCGPTSYESREFASDDGLIVRLVRLAQCFGPDGERRQGELTFEGIDDDGWYWIAGDYNAAVAPLVRESSLRPELLPPIPDGVSASPSGDQRFVLSVTGRLYGTLVDHDTNGFIGIIPHIVDLEGAGQHAAPFWRGHGGVVGRPLDGVSATFRLVCADDRTQTYELEPRPDGIIAHLLDGCFDGDGDPIDGRLEADGLEDGAWYWLNHGRLWTGEINPDPLPCRPGACSAAAPLVRRDAVPDSLTSLVVPEGVEVDRGPLGALVTQGKQFGIVTSWEPVQE